MEWIRTLCLLLLGVSLVLLLLPEGCGKRATALAAGAGLAVMILSGLRGLSSDRAARWISEFGKNASGTETSGILEKEILQSRVAAYIEARAAELGGNLRAEVTLSEREKTVVVTDLILRGKKDGLSDFPARMEEELGVPRENIKWMDS